VFEGNGRIQEYVGGYDDWVRQRAATVPPAPPARRQTRAGGASESSAVATTKKLSYKERRELADLPARIEALEAEQSELNAAVSHPEFYRESAEAIVRTLARIAELQGLLHQVYARWDELDSRSA
jgi:ATP-binding cassette subfamily F protein uup